MRDHFLVAIYVLLLGASSAHLYVKPIYDMDSVQYMGNALLMEERDIVRVHARVYSDLRISVPPAALRGLLGWDPTAPPDQNESRRERARNPYNFAEFLPFFAIRPLYNQSLWIASKAGLGLVRSAILISVLSYFALGILLFSWVSRYATTAFSTMFCFLLMISPPLTDLGRDLTSDAMATAVAFASLYMIFARGKLSMGILLLLLSIYVRTDFVVLAGPILMLCWMDKLIDFWKVCVLGVLAVGSVLVINHFSGDYGIEMLYYRNFVGVPLAPAESGVRFTFHQYLSAFRSGLALALNSFLVPFLALGLVGLISRHTRALFAAALSYVVLHFLILPNWQERWVGVFYLCCGICAAAVVGRVERNVVQKAAA